MSSFVLLIRPVRLSAYIRPLTSRRRVMTCARQIAWYRSYSEYMSVQLRAIDYGLRARRRRCLTLPRLALDRNPWFFGEEVVHLFDRYPCQHSHF